MALMKLLDPLTRRRVEVEAAEIGRSDTRTLDQAGRIRWKWNELTVWKINPETPDGPYRWAFRKAGMSVIYHSEPTTCTIATGDPSGLPATVDDLPDDAVPCPRCRPPRPEILEERAERGTITRVRFEFPRVTTIQLDTPQKVVDTASMKVDPGRDVSEGLSRPAAELIGQCMMDPDFRAGVEYLPGRI